VRLRCYVCGAALGDRFFLVTYEQVSGSDRVFVVGPECGDHVEAEAGTCEVVLSRPRR